MTRNDIHCTRHALHGQARRLPSAFSIPHSSEEEDASIDWHVCSSVTTPDLMKEMLSAPSHYKYLRSSTYGHGLIYYHKSLSSGPNGSYLHTYYYAYVCFCGYLIGISSACRHNTRSIGILLTARLATWLTIPHHFLGNFATHYPLALYRTVILYC